MNKSNSTLNHTILKDQIHRNMKKASSLDVTLCEWEVSSGTLKEHTGFMLGSSNPRRQLVDPKDQSSMIIQMLGTTHPMTWHHIP
jgi:hypothetical protein